jgi:lysophospholipase L1-like esterase
MRKRNNWMLVLALILLSSSSKGQQDSIHFDFKRYGFENEEANVIQNQEPLSAFFERLFQLRKGIEEKVAIIQIGDSHIQADYLSGMVRQNIQRDFGNAGRGLIVPGKVAHTNEPPNIATSSTNRWDAKRIVYPDAPLPIGIGGITIQTLQPNASFSLKTFDYPSLSYSFNKLTFFYKKDITSYNLVIKDTVDHPLAYVGPYTIEPFSFTSTVNLPFPTNKITIETLPSTPMHTQMTLYGINLENDSPGILYHAIGVNGAKYKHYNATELFAPQTQVLQPELFIISLGTNEALDYPYLDPKLFDHIDRLVDNLKVNNPHAQFLFTTPPDAYRKKTRRNPGLRTVRDIIIRYANEHNLAYWDLYETLGGNQSADLYRKEGLLRLDGIHFTREGYELQGNMFYSALIKAYNLYVQYRHP